MKHRNKLMVKIAFSGIGGVGGYYGGMLAAFYEPFENVGIYFISRGENLKVIREKGLHIRTDNSSLETHPLLATSQPEEIGIVDYLFCTTKSYDLEENIAQLSPVIGPGTVIIPLLNGANITENIQRILPRHEIWYGCVYIGARLSAPGLITKFTRQERIWFGHPNGNRKKQEQLLKWLTDAGINAENPEDIVFRIWKKFFLISVSATLTSYYDQSIGEILEFHREDYFRLSRELLRIAQAKGIILPEDMAERVIADQTKIPYAATTSMHTDFRNGKRMELETLTGYVVQTGQEHGIPTPVYEMMYKKLKQFE